MAFELAAKLPDYRSNLIAAVKKYPCYNAAALDEVLNYYRELSDSELFDSLFHCDYINTIYGNGKVVICIDALDEAEIQTDNSKWKNPIIDLLISKRDLWPQGFFFVLTSRDEPQVVSQMEIFGNDIEIVDLKREESDNDIGKYLTNRLVKTGKIDKAYIDELVIRCEKTFIYADLLVKSIEDGTVSIATENDVNNLPKGYRGLLFSYFNRLFPGDSYESVKRPLGLIVANGGSMPISVINKIMRHSNRTWDHVLFVDKMRSFVVEKDGSLFFYHKAINDWIISNQASEFHLCQDDYREDIVQFDNTYINEFEALKYQYSDATGLELLDDAPENGYTYETNY